MRRSQIAGQALSISLDTNVLVRLAVEDDAVQAAAARSAFDQAELVFCSLPMLCELVWVLSGFYEMPIEEIVAFLQMLATTEKIRVDRSAVAVGISCLLAGGDFADGVIAELGRSEGADVFLTFDRKARRAIGKLEIPVASPDQLEP